MGADCVDDAWIRVIPCRLAVEDREEDVDEACSCARSMIDAGVEEEEAVTLLLFFEEAKDAEGTVRDAEVFKILLIEEVDDAGKAALLLLLFFEAVPALAELIGLRTEDAGVAEVLMAMLIALPALVLRSGVPSDLSPDAAVAVVALEGGRITLDAAGEVDRVGCFSIDWTVGLFPVMLALEAASAISRLVCWRRPEDVSLQYG